MSAQAGGPLRGVLGVAPARSVRGNERLGALLEGHGPGAVELSVKPSGSPFLERIDAVAYLAPRVFGEITGSLERHAVERA